MQVRTGWSGEIAPNRWAKFDITLDEEDLRRLLGPDYRDLPALSPAIAYQILEIESERLVHAKLVTRYGMDEVEGRKAIEALDQQRAMLVEQVRRSE